MAGGGDGGEGRMKGENTGRGGLGQRQRPSRCRSLDFLSTPGGMEGRGQQRTPLLPLRVDEGVGWHICASYFLPLPVPAVSSMGAGVNPTRRPPFDLVYPPHWGVSSPVLLMTMGAACALHAAPFLFFTPEVRFPPLLGGLLFFSTAVSPMGAVYDPPTPLPSFLSIYQGFFFCSRVIDEGVAYNPPAVPSSLVYPS